MTMGNSLAANHASEQGARFTYQSIVKAVFAVFVFSGLVSFVEPSPYDFMALFAIPVWFLGGFRIHRVQVPILMLWCIFELSGFAALMPYWNDTDARVYQFQSLYLFLTVVCFTLFFGERTLERAEICLKAFTLGAVVSAFVSILSYFDIAGLGGQLITVEGRVSGTFKDPNVFGSYLTLGAAFVFQDLLIGKGKRLIASAIGLLLLLIGVFISYSRGSWGATIASLTLITIVTYATSDSNAARRRIVIMSAIIVCIVALTLLAILSNDDVRDFFLQRAGTHDYDEGANGRFGNQLRSIPMLLDRPEGFGPLQFRYLFEIEPHNSYIGGFANDGWIGGFAWIFLVLSTSFVGFRLIFVRSPYRRLAQVAWPALFVLFLQGFQIDIDHWRQVFLLVGMIWGLEAARVRWLEREQYVQKMPRSIRASETYV
jgi:hypothetical protein